MILTRGGRLYTGITTDVDRRFDEHCRSPRGAKFFRSDPAEQVVYKEPCESRSEASRREREIKSLRAAQKRALIAQAKGNDK